MEKKTPLRLEVPLNSNVRAIFRNNPSFKDWDIRYAYTEYDLRAICNTGELPTPTMWQTECKLCGSQSVDSKAFKTDVLEKKNSPNQMMRTSDAAGLVDCKKCKKCGHSFILPNQNVVELMPGYLLATISDESVCFYDESANLAYEELWKYRGVIRIEDKELFEAYELYLKKPVSSLLPFLSLVVEDTNIEFVGITNQPYKCMHRYFFRAAEVAFWYSPYWELVKMGTLIEAGAFGGVGHEGTLLVNFARAVLTEQILLMPIESAMPYRNALFINSQTQKPYSKMEKNKSNELQSELQKREVETTSTENHIVYGVSCEKCGFSGLYPKVCDSQECGSRERAKELEMKNQDKINIFFNLLKSFKS